MSTEHESLVAQQHFVQLSTGQESKHFLIALLLNRVKSLNVVNS